MPPQCRSRADRYFVRAIVAAFAPSLHYAAPDICLRQLCMNIRFIDKTGWFWSFVLNISLTLLSLR